MGEIILCDLSDANTIIKNIQKEWTYGVLVGLGVSKEIEQIDDIFKFRSVLSNLGIYVESKSCGEEIDIYKCAWSDVRGGGWLPPSKKYLIAQWKRPVLKKRIDRRGAYYEIHFNKWSMVKITEGG